jgi:biotin carboxyl carrier protein
LAEIKRVEKPVRLKAQILTEEHEVAITRRSGALSADVDGREYEIEVIEISERNFVLRQGNEIFECLIGSSLDHPELLQIHLRGALYQIRITDPKRLRSSESTGHRDHGMARLLAAMPGKVVRVLVGVGAEVEAGAAILVVEAMKMQNEIKAPKSGTVSQLAAPGTTVNAGDLLALIE